MTADERKMLTEFLGECWHNWKWPSPYAEDHKFIRYCTKCREMERMGTSSERTFTTPADLNALCLKLKERREWNNFHFFATGKFIKAENKSVSYRPDFTYWILVESPERTCQLIVEFIGEKGLKEGK